MSKQNNDETFDQTFTSTRNVPTTVFSRSKFTVVEINNFDFERIKGTDFGIVTSALIATIAGQSAIIIAKLVIAISNSGQADMIKFNEDLITLVVVVVCAFASMGWERFFPSKRRKVINEIKAKLK